MSITAEDVRRRADERGVGIMVAKAQLMHEAHEFQHVVTPKSLAAHAAELTALKRRADRLEFAVVLLVIYAVTHAVLSAVL